MTRAKRFFGAILMGLMLCACLLFGACGKDNKIEGTYKFSKMIYNEGGMQIEIDAGEEFMGMMTLTEDFMKLTLNEDGTAVMTAYDGESTETATGTWVKVDGETLSIIFDGEAEQCKWNENTITMEDVGSKIILKK